MVLKNIEFKIGQLYTIISTQKHGVIYEEPTLIAIDNLKNKIVAVGKSAEQMKGRSNDNIKIIEPLKEGSVIDVTNTVKMLKIILKNKLDISLMYNSTASIVVPIDLNQIELILYENIFKELGFKNIEIKNIPLSLSLKNCSKCLVNIGNYKSEIMFFSKNNLLTSCKMIDIGQRNIIEKIKKEIYNEEKMTVSDNEINKILYQFDNQKELDKKINTNIKIKGQDMETKLPKIIDFPTQKIKEIIEWKVNKLVEKIKDTYFTIPKKMQTDIIKNYDFYIENPKYPRNILSQRIKECII